MFVFLVVMTYCTFLMLGCLNFAFLFIIEEEYGYCDISNGASDTLEICLLWPFRLILVLLFFIIKVYRLIDVKLIFRRCKLKIMMIKSDSIKLQVLKIKKFIVNYIDELKGIIL